MVEFPQLSAGFLPSGLGEISLRRHQKLVSAENPDSVAFPHPSGCVTHLRNTRGEAWRDVLTWGVHVSMGWGTQRGPWQGSRGLGSCRCPKFPLWCQRVLVGVTLISSAASDC